MAAFDCCTFNMAPIRLYRFDQLLKLVGSWSCVLALVSQLAFSVSADSSLSGTAASLYRKAKDESRWFAKAEALHTEVRPTSDGMSFFVVWRASPAPAKWIVSLHGAGQPAKGFATDDLAIWAPHLKDRNVGLVCLQWWLGQGDGIESFYTPVEINREIDRVLRDLHVKAGNVMLHGFSRGAANAYAVAALDAGRGRHNFSLIVASSGGYAADYPPNRGIVNGELGDHPLKGTRWITVARARDPNPQRDGIEGMRRTARWLKEQGAVVLESIEDPKFGHGALQLNPQNATHVLDIFLK